MRRAGLTDIIPGSTDAAWRTLTALPNDVAAHGEVHAGATAAFATIADVAEREARGAARCVGKRAVSSDAASRAAAGATSR